MNNTVIVVIIVSLIIIITILSIISLVLINNKPVSAEKEIDENKYKILIDDNNKSLDIFVKNLKQSLPSVNTPDPTDALKIGTINIFPIVDDMDKYLPFVPCDGRQLELSKYPDLAALLGTKYNLTTTDSSKYFNIPNATSPLLGKLPSPLTLPMIKPNILIDNQKCPLPLTATFTSAGGNIVFFIKYSLWSFTDNNTSGGIDVFIDNVNANQVKTILKTTYEHVESQNTFVVNNLSSGSHTLSVNVIPNTNVKTDDRDNLTVILMEMAPVSLSADNKDVYNLFLSQYKMGLFIKAL